MKIENTTHNSAYASVGGLVVCKSLCFLLHSLLGGKKRCKLSPTERIMRETLCTSGIPPQENFVLKTIFYLPNIIRQKIL
jgi:hypothetical protein